MRRDLVPDASGAGPGREDLGVQLATVDGLRREALRSVEKGTLLCQEIVHGGDFDERTDHRTLEALLEARLALKAQRWELATLRKMLALDVDEPPVEKAAE